MSKDLYLNQFALRAADVVLLNILGYLRHLTQRQLASRDHHIGKLGEESHRLDIANVALRRDMHLDTNAVGVGYHSHVAGDDGADTNTLGLVDEMMHLVNLMVIDYRIDRQVGTQTMLMGNTANLFQVFDGEVSRGTRPHIKVADTEINGVGTSLDCSLQALIRAYRRHYFYLAVCHLSLLRCITTSPSIPSDPGTVLPSRVASVSLMLEMLKSPCPCR